LVGVSIAYGEVEPRARKGCGRDLEITVATMGIDWKTVRKLGLEGRVAEAK